MKIDVTVADITTDKSVDAPLRISAVADTGTVEQITVSGLPTSAKLSAGTRRTDGIWDIKAADLRDLRITWSGDPINLQVTASGTANGQAISGSVNARIAFKSTSAPTGTAGMIWTTLGLLTITIVVFICWRILFANAQELLAKDWSAPWDKPIDVAITSGPITFWYDSKAKLLHHRGPMDTAEKIQLQGLARVTSVGGAGTSQSSSRENQEVQAGTTSSLHDSKLASYFAALDQLAFESNGLGAKYSVYLLSIAGLSGLLGAQIRTFANFIYISTRRRNDLNLHIWWPWYVLRPALAFLLGIIAVLLVEGKLFTPTTESSQSGTVWWVAFAMLAGFAADEFSQRLRLVGQALFGKDKDDKRRDSAQAGARPKPTNTAQTTKEINN